MDRHSIQLSGRYTNGLPLFNLIEDKTQFHINNHFNPGPKCLVFFADEYTNKKYYIAKFFESGQLYPHLLMRKIICLMR